MIEYYEEIDSTNTRCIDLGRNRAEDLSAVIALKQCSGRGRKGRSWCSDDPGGLYFTVLVRSGLEIDKVSMMTLVMAFSICRFLRDRQIECGIKWPNDIIMNGRKICGILTELQQDDEGEFFLAVGVGINVNNIEFDPQLADKATSIYRETGVRFIIDNKADRISLVKEIIGYFREDRLRVEEVGDLAPVLKEYEGFLVNRNARVRILDPQEEYEALSVGIDPSGGLKVLMDDGNVRVITGGEVSVRGIMGYI